MSDAMTPSTTLVDARRRCLVALLKPASYMRPSGFGYVGFPSTRFRKPQGAAFASAKLRRAMLADGVITFHRNHGGAWSGEFELTEKGRAEVAAGE